MFQSVFSIFRLMDIFLGFKIDQFVVTGVREILKSRVNARKS